MALVAVDPGRWLLRADRSRCQSGQRRQETHLAHQASFSVEMAKMA